MNQTAQYIQTKFDEYEKYTRRANKLHAFLTEIALVGVTQDLNKLNTINNMLGGVIGEDPIDFSETGNNVEEKIREEKTKAREKWKAAKTIKDVKSSELSITKTKKLIKEMQELATRLNTEIFTKIENGITILKVKLEETRGRSTPEKQQIALLSSRLIELQNATKKLKVNFSKKVSEYDQISLGSIKL